MIKMIQMTASAMKPATCQFSLVCIDVIKMYAIHRTAATTIFGYCLTSLFFHAIGAVTMGTSALLSLLVSLEPHNFVTDWSNS